MSGDNPLYDPGAGGGSGHDFAAGRAAAQDVLAAARAYTDSQLKNWIGRVRVSVDGAPDVAARHRLDFLGGVPIVDDPTRDRLRIGPLSAGGAGDWKELVTYTVPAGSGQASIDFAGLSQSYKALVAVGDNIQYETFSATTGHPVCFLMNGWNGNDYLERVHRSGNSGGSIHDVVTPTAANAGTVGYAPGGVGDDPIGSFVCWFPGYASTTKYKTYHGHGVYSFGTTTLRLDTGGFARLGSATHINVDRLTFYAGYDSGGSPTDLFAPGSRITIYGVGPI